MAADDLERRLREDTLVAKDDLASQMYQSLVHKIVTRTLQPGEKLSIATVARAYDVSVTPVREAFKRLAAEGLIEIRPRRDSVVATITAEHLLHIYEIRNLIEAHAVRRHFRDETLQAMRECTTAMAKYESDRLYEDFDLYWQYSRHDAQFHQLIVKETGNPRLVEFYSSLHAHSLVAPILFGHRKKDRAMHQAREHDDIIAALERSDFEEAAAATVSHLESVLAIILERTVDSGNTGKAKESR